MDDIDYIRSELDALDTAAREALGDRFHFATLTVWGSSHRKRHAALSLTLHIANNGTKSIPAGNLGDAFVEAHRYLAERAPAAVEATGWAILGVVRA